MKRHRISTLLAFILTSVWLLPTISQPVNATPFLQTDPVVQCAEGYNWPLLDKQPRLSAYETQIDDLSAGDEVVGLTRALIFAGTPSVIASLWPVDDKSSTLLMERFYTHLRAGMGKAEALRQAQIELREDYPNPYYWSAFVGMGWR